MSAIILIVSAVGTVASLAVDWFPTLATEKGGRIDTLYYVLLAISVFICVGVLTFTALVVWRFRAGENESGDGPPIHGNTRVEVIWTTIPAIIVTVLAVYAWMVLDDIEAKQPNELKVKVVGQQFAWRFEYPTERVKSEQLVVPINRPIDFDIVSEDVIHSFFVPAARLKRDAVKGIVTKLRFTPNRLGSYPIICAELCGIGHATMRQTMRVISEADYHAWLEDQRAPATAADGGDEDAGKQVFTAAGCGACHTLADAGATGKAAPPLDDLASATKGDLDTFIRESIVDPAKVVAKGYGAGIMPADYESRLKPAELDSLVEYLARVGKK